MSNKLCRVSGPSSFRLMAVELADGQWIGETSGGLSLRDDIAQYRRPNCRPLYAIFVRPRSPLVSA